jgi:hypothetical protein
VLAGFNERDIVKVKKLKNQPGQIRWQYVLTPAGMKEKIKITKQYLEKRLAEFDELQQEIILLKKQVREDA